MKRVLHTLVLLVLVPGCPSNPSVDASRPDLGVSDDTSAFIDTPPTDSDGDSVPDSEDCDPASASIGRSYTRPCSGECGAGTESCADGVWAPCVPAIECRCTTEGMRRIADCGLCGERSEECQSGAWVPLSACVNEGLCTPGDVETRSGEMCLEEQRICGADCLWDPWSVTTPMGACTAGKRVCLPGAMLDHLCTDDCRLVDNPCCPLTDPLPPECL